MKIAYSALTNKGKTRKENQDCLLLARYKSNDNDFFTSGTISTDSLPCFAVFDGVGGGQCGREASDLAAEVLLSKKGAGSLLETFYDINIAIEKFIQDNSLFTMGTTAAAIVFGENTAEICNIGDSGIYCFYQNRMVRLFENHSIQIGTAGKRYLTQYLGIGQEEMQIEPFSQMVKLCSGYRFLLCSDGLTDLVSEAEIAEIVSEDSAADACKRLFEQAMTNGGNDNISIIIADVTE